MSTAIERLARDMEALARVEGRYAGSEGERAMLHAVRERLPPEATGRIEGFVGHTAPALVVGLHAAALLLAGLVGFWLPAVGMLVALLVTLSLLAEGSGRVSLFRWFMLKAPSYNLVVRQQDPQPLGSLVLVAPLDAPRWRPARLSWVRGRRPMRIVLIAAMVVVAMLALRALAEPWGPRTFEIYVVALLVLATGMALGAVAHRRAGTGRDDGSGPAVIIEVLRRLQADPPPGLDLWIAFTGCGRAHQDGMGAFLDLHRLTLQDPALVVAVDDPGRVPLRAVISEGPLWARPHRPTGPALVERLRWAGVIVPEMDRPNASDAHAALARGYRALGLCGGVGPSTPETAARAADVLETVARWYADDLARVADNRPALQELARAIAARRETRPELPAPDEEGEQPEDAAAKAPAPPAEAT